MYQDAHLHIAFGSALSISTEIGRVFLNSTGPSDYSAVKSASEHSTDVIPFYGLHPWHVRNESFSAQLLSSILKASPSAGIGETGLDSSPQYKPDIGRQLSLFRVQIELASSLARPVSVHCVRSWQLLFNILERHVPLKKPFILHSFYGSKEVLEHLLKYGAYISISSLSLRNPQRSYPVIEAVPLDRLLIESDMICGSKGFSAVSHLQELKNIYNEASGILGISESELAARIWDNGTIFTN